MSHYIAIRSIPPTELYTSASSVRYKGIWYPVLGYDPTDGIFCLDNPTGDDIEVLALLFNYTSIRVEVQVRNIHEVLDTMENF